MCNGWRKVGPFPGLTEPGRFHPPPEIEESSIELANLASQQRPYTWKSMKWNELLLTTMITTMRKYRDKFDSEKNQNGVLPWLVGVDNPTTAIIMADVKFAETLSDQEEDGLAADFFDASWL